MEFIQAHFPNMTVVLSYLKSDLIKKQRSFKIGLISIFLVIWFTAMLMNLISLNCLIFMRLIEDSVGEADFVFTPMLSTKDTKFLNSSFETLVLNKENRSTNFFDVKFIDFYDLKERLKGVKTLQGIAPRWILQGNTTNTYENKTNWAMSNLIILDSDLEKNQGMGRKVKIHSLYEDECYVSSSLFRSLKLNFKNNSNVVIDVKLSALLRALGKLEDEESEEEEEEDNVNGGGFNNFIKFGKGGKLKDFNKEYPSSKNSFYDYHNDDEDYYEQSENSNNEINVNELNVSNFFNSNKIQQVNILKLVIKKILSINNNNKINIDLDKLYKSLNANFPKNFTFSLDKLDNPLIINLPFMKAIKSLIISEINNYNISNSILSKIFDIDIEKKTLKFKDIENITNYENQKISLDLSNLIEIFTDEELDEIFSFNMPFKVKEHISSTSGKWPSASGNVVAVDAKFMKRYLQKNFERIAEIISSKLRSEFIYDVLVQMSKNILKNFDIYKYTLSVNAVLKDKFSAYRHTGSKLRIHMAKEANKLMQTLGYDYPITITTPIFSSYQGIEMGQIMLVNIFRAIMVFLWILSILLVYSLMLGNVEERTYEFGMLRSMGFKKISLIGMIIIQGFIFAIPGIILGFLTGYTSNNYIEFLLNIYSGLTMPYFINSNTIIWCSLVGLGIVLVSCYFPIKKALDANLKETLTIFNKKIGDLVVNMVKLEKLGISPSSLVASIVIIAIGISTYYIAPSSFLKLNPDIFVFIMIMILIIMILGLIIITQVFMPKIQEFILFIIMIIAYKDKNLHFLVKKNLVGHSRRNKKVSIMFMVALSFVIFAGCTLNLVVEFIRTFTKSALGGDAAFWIIDGTSLNQIELDRYMNDTRKKFPNLIYNYTWVGQTFRHMLKKRTILGALNGFPAWRRKISGVDENLIYSGYQDLYSVSDYDKSLNYTYIKGTKKVNLVSMLYLNDHVPPIIPSNSLINFPINPTASKFKLKIQLNLMICEGLTKHFAIGIKNPASIAIKTRHPQKIPCKIVGVAKKLPGFPAYSSYYTLAFMTSGLTSLKQMKDLITQEIKMYPELNATYYKNKGILKTPDGLPKQGLFIKFYDNTDSKMRSMVFSEIKNIFDRDGAIAIILDDIIKTTNKAQKIMGYIFLVLGIIALILSFFLIWTSFYNNIKDNICEYGIMRSIGLTKQQSTRMFLYEAASIIISSIITGTIIGVVVSVTLILQFNIFVELPFIFKFPTQLYLVLVILGLCLGMLGSYYPVLEVNHMSLVKIMKGLSE